MELQSSLVKNRKPNKYHPYTKKFPGTDVMGTCPICQKDVLRSDGFIVEEKYEPSMHKVYVHHSKWDKCSEIHFQKQKEENERQRKKDLGLPENPLDHLLKSKK